MAALLASSPMEVITTDRAPKPVGPYSQALLRGGHLYIAGQIPLDPRTSEVVGKTIEDQGARVLENLRGIVESAGFSLKDVIKTTVYLTDLGDFPKFNQLYETFFGTHKPARSVLQAAALPKGVRIELDAVCIGEV